MTDLKKVERKIEWRKTLGRVDRPIDPKTFDIVWENEPCLDKGYYYENLSRRLSYSKCYNQEGIASFIEYRDGSTTSRTNNKSRPISRLESPSRSQFGSRSATPTQRSGSQTPSKMKKKKKKSSYQPSKLKKYDFLNFDDLDKRTSRKINSIEEEEDIRNQDPEIQKGIEERQSRILGSKTKSRQEITDLDTVLEAEKPDETMTLAEMMNEELEKGALENLQVGDTEQENVKELVKELSKSQKQSQKASRKQSKKSSRRNSVTKSSKKQNPTPKIPSLPLAPQTERKQNKPSKQDGRSNTSRVSIQSRKDMVSKLMENVEKSILEVNKTGREGDISKRSSDKNLPQNILGGLDQDYESQASSLKFESTANDNMIIPLTEPSSQLNTQRTDFEESRFEKRFESIPEIEKDFEPSSHHKNTSLNLASDKFSKKNNDTLVLASQNETLLEDRIETKRNHPRKEEQKTKRRTRVEIDERAQQQRLSIRYDQAPEPESVIEAKNSNALAILSKKQFQDGNILSPIKPSNYPPEEAHFRENIPSLGGLKIQNVKHEDEPMEAVFTADKGLIFVKKKVIVKKLRIHRVKDDGAKNLRIDTIPRRGKQAAKNSSPTKRRSRNRKQSDGRFQDLYRDSFDEEEEIYINPQTDRKYPNRSSNSRRKNAQTDRSATRIKHAATHFYNIPNHAAKRSSRKQHDTMDSLITNTQIQRDTERPNLNDPDLARRLKKAQKQKKKKLLELRKKSYQFENRIVEDEQVGVRVGLNMLHTDELLDYYKEVISKGRKDFIAHSKNGGISIEY